MNDFLWGSDSACDGERCDNGSKSIMHLSPGALAQSVHCAAFFLGGGVYWDFQSFILLH